VWKVGAYYSTNAKIENNNGGTDQPGFNPANGGLNQCPAANPTCTTNNGVAIGVPTGNALTNMLVPGQAYQTGENSQNAIAQVIWHDFEWYIGDTWKVRRNITFTYGFRWSFFREPYSQDNAWTSWSPTNWSAAEAALNPSDACNGLVVVPGTDPCGSAVKQLNALGISLPLSSGTPGVNRALVANNNHTISPRLGVAWDPKGDGRTAFRIGVGQFYQRDPVGHFEGATFNVPTVIGANDTRTLETPSPLANPSVSPSFSMSPRGVIPNSWQYNISVQRELVRNMTLQLGYVGNVGMHLTSGYQINAIPIADWVQAAFLNGNALNALRPATNFGSIGQWQHEGHATYNSMQALYKWQLGNYSTVQAAYTWSHSIGNVGLADSSGSVDAPDTITDNSNFKLDKGNTQINRPNIFVMNEVFYLPKLANKAALLRQTAGGWELNSIITVSSGASLNVYANGAGAYQSAAGAGTDPCSTNDITNGTCVIGPNVGALNSLQGSGWNNNNRPDRNLSVNCNSNTSGRTILNLSAFTEIGHVIGTPGDTGRGVCHGPTYRNFDMTLAKNWYFKEHFRLKFGLDFFNILNHANFYSVDGTNVNASGLICGTLIPGNGTTANPDHYAPCSATNNVVSKSTSPSSGFGLSNSVHPGRELQYSLKLYF